MAHYEMDMLLEKFKTENSRLLRDWYHDCESLHKQIVLLKQENDELKEALQSLSQFVGARAGESDTTAQERVKRIKQAIIQMRG